MPDHCPACHHPESFSSIRRPPHRYWVCAGCGSATLTSETTGASYEGAYFLGGEGSGYYDYRADREIHLDTAARRLGAITSLLPSTTRIVDVGAAYGYTLEAARSRGWEATGVEVSEHAQNALRKAGFEVVGDLAEVVPGSADAVLFGQVLEHMPDPEEAIARATNALRPGGVIFIETWDRESNTAKRFGSRWQQISPPSVVHLFSERGLRRLLERHGLEVVSSGPWRKRVSVRGYLGVIASKLPTALGRAMMGTANVSGVTRLAITYRFDDLISVIARKPVG